MLLVQNLVPDVGRHLVQDAEGMGTVAVPGSLPDGCDKAGHGRLDLVGDGLES